MGKRWALHDPVRARGRAFGEELLDRNPSGEVVAFSWLRKSKVDWTEMDLQRIGEKDGREDAVAAH